MFGGVQLPTRKTYSQCQIARGDDYIPISGLLAEKHTLTCDNTFAEEHMLTCDNNFAEEHMLSYDNNFTEPGADVNM